MVESDSEGGGDTKTGIGRARTDSVSLVRFVRIASGVGAQKGHAEGPAVAQDVKKDERALAVSERLLDHSSVFI